MAIKDKVIDWYLKNIYLSKAEDLENPGFICEHVGEQKGTFLREIAIPENLLVEIEKQFDSKTLYSIGKKFGYGYALASDFVTIGKTDKKKFLQDAYFLVRYIESISYGKNLKHEIDYEKRIFRLTADDYVICRKSGGGYLFSSGGVSGIWSYFVEDQNVEGVHEKCQGRGDKKCEIICGPASELKKMGLKFFTMNNLKNLDLGHSYGEINKIRQAQYAKNSLKNLMDSGVFRYSHGIINYKDERFFLSEASFMYIIEKELRGKDLSKLFEISYEWGEQLAKNEKKNEPIRFIQDFFPALGWGDILVMKKDGKYSVYVNYFPWTKWHKEIKYVVFRGTLSGIISGFEGKKIHLNKITTDLSRGYFSLACSE
jgi:hypothetical protein